MTKAMYDLSKLSNKLIDLPKPFPCSARKYSFFFMFLLFVSSNISAQQIHHILNANSASDQLSAEDEKTKEARLHSLISELHPALYFKEGQLTKTYKENPVCIKMDIASLGVLNNNNPSFANVEIITIKVSNTEDLEKALKLNDIKGFSKLKYIYFICDFYICPEQPNNKACEDAKISSMVEKDTNSPIEIIYKINVGS